MSITNETEICDELCVIYRQYARFMDEVGKMKYPDITEHQRKKLEEVSDAIDAARQAFLWVTP